MDGITAARRSRAWRDLRGLGRVIGSCVGASGWRVALYGVSVAYGAELGSRLVCCGGTVTRISGSLVVVVVVVGRAAAAGTEQGHDGDCEESDETADDGPGELWIVSTLMLMTESLEALADMWDGPGVSRVFRGVR